MKVELDAIEETAKLLYIRALKVLPDDIKEIFLPALRHRIALSYEANADGVSSNDVINEILKLVAVA